MDIIDDEFCKDTPIRDYKCTLCGKKLAFVDSPFGPIPSLDLIKKFYEDFIGFFEEQKNELADYTKSEVIEAYKEKQDLFNNFLTESQKKFNVLDEKLTGKLTDFDSSVKNKVKLI